MEEVIILEVLGKSGGVNERVRLSSFPVSVGRAYDNDVILDDEHVSPHHLLIERDAQGGLRARDLNSENGLYQIPALHRVDAVSIAADSQLLLGNTHIRLRRTDFAVAPTVLSNRRRPSAQNRMTRGWLLVLLLLMVAGMTAMESYLQTFQKVKYQELLLATLSPLLMLLAWAGLWAFIGRILGHRSAYPGHANMVLMAMLALFGLDYLADYYSFVFSAAASVHLMEAFALALIGGVLLFGHMRLATQLSRKRGALAAGMVACSLLGMTLFVAHVRNAQFNSDLIYPAVLKPASGMIREPLLPEVFFAKAQQMKESLDKAKLEDN